MQQNGNTLIEVNAKSYKVAIVYCHQLPCTNPKLQPGDIETIFPICGPDVFEVPPIEKMEHALQFLEEKEPSAMNRDLRRGLPRKKICPQGVLAP